MKDDDRIDLSALDGLADPARFEERVRRLTARALVARRRASRGVLGQLAAWARPALVTTAGLAVLAWLPLLWAPARLPPARPADSPETRLLEWASRARMPNTEELLLTFGGPRVDAP